MTRPRCTRSESERAGDSFRFFVAYAPDTVCFVSSLSVQQYRQQAVVVDADNSGSPRRRSDRAGGVLVWYIP